MMGWRNNAAKKVLNIGKIRVQPGRPLVNSVAQQAHRVGARRIAYRLDVSIFVEVDPRTDSDALR